MSATTIQRKTGAGFGGLHAIGTRIAQARKDKGLTQQDMSDLLSKSKATKVTRITIGVWEKNETTPSIEQVFAIAKVTDVDPIWLITGTGDQSEGGGGTVEVGLAEIDTDGSLELVGNVVVSPQYFDHFDGDYDNLAAIHYRHGACQYGRIDWVFFDTTQTSPPVTPSLFLYHMSGADAAMVTIRKVAPKDGKDRVHLLNEDLMIDDTAFLEDVKILGKVIRWCGNHA
jgi:transcriptional regulator with XRE-family HTH domain